MNCVVKWTRFSKFFNFVKKRRDHKQTVILLFTIIILELDESAIHRRKFNRGRRKPLIWIWTAVERKPGGGNSGLYIIKVVKNGTAVNLLRIIKDTIAPGTTLIND